MTVCMVIRAPVSRYPPCLYQAALFLRSGAEVWILDIEDSGHAAGKIPVGVRRRILEDTRASIRGYPLVGSVAREMGRQQFQRRLGRELKRIQPDVVIAYDPPAYAMIGRLFPRGAERPFVLAWQPHEYPEEDATIGFGTRRDLLWCRSNADLVDLWIFPDASRAHLFAEDVNLSVPTEVVMNCPLRQDSLPSPSLREFLREGRHPAQEHIVLYCGSVGASHGLETAVKSMAHWPTDVTLALVGPCHDSVRQALMQMARTYKVADRVAMTGPAPPELLWGIRRGATIALTVLEPTCISWEYSAGASNKRFEAMAAGVAQITDCGRGVAELIEATGSGICIQHNDYESMGKAVTKLLCNPSQIAVMKENARRVHLDRLNYETEFQPLLERLKAMCARYSR